MEKTIYSPSYRALIGRLRATRIERGLRQAQVAKMLSVSRQWLGHVETCQIRIDVLQLTSWCQALGLNAPDLVRMLEEGR